MLIRLVYASIADRGNDDDEIDRIVAFSLAHNPVFGITGVLACDGPRIVQILEGPSGAVVELFGRITIDRRHTGVTELVKVGIARQTFSTWGMVRRPISDVMITLDRLR